MTFSPRRCTPPLPPPVQQRCQSGAKPPRKLAIQRLALATCSGWLLYAGWSLTRVKDGCFPSHSALFRFFHNNWQLRRVVVLLADRHKQNIDIDLITWLFDLFSDRQLMFLNLCFRACLSVCYLAGCVWKRDLGSFTERENPSSNFLLNSTLQYIPVTYPPSHSKQRLCYLIRHYPLTVYVAPSSDTLQI